VSLAQLTEDFLKHLLVRNQSPLTIRNDRSRLRQFLLYLERQHVTEPQELRREHVEDYLDELTWAPTKRGKPLSVTTRNLRLAALKGFARWLYEHDFLGHDPAAAVEYAREPMTLPRNVLSEADAFKLLAAPDGRTPLGFRDRTALEVLYASGMRVGELVGLDVSDVDVGTGCALIRRGKGDKDRVVPIGRRVSATVQSYVTGVRPELVQSKETALLVNYKGGRWTTAGVGRMVAAYGEEAGIEKRVTPHVLRHSCATHMMRRGASLRCVQELLGHAAVTSTEVYTHLTGLDLIEAHSRFHPREQQPEALPRPARQR
jgi:integrase/recombinase XerD